MLGENLYDGEGVTKDVAEAIRFYRLPAYQGNANALADTIII